MLLIEANVLKQRPRHSIQCLFSADTEKGEGKEDDECHVRVKIIPISYFNWGIFDSLPTFHCHVHLRENYPTHAHVSRA